jgi:hypothetical protein
MISIFWTRAASSSPWFGCHRQLMEKETNMSKKMKGRLIRLGSAKRLTKGGDIEGSELLVQTAFPG